MIPVPDSGTPAAIGYAEGSALPFDLGIIRNHYVGRTFIEPTDQIRHMGVKLKHNANRAVIAGKRVVLVDDSIVRGTTSLKIVQMVREAGATEVHMRIASPPTSDSCFYGVNTPEKSKLIASRMNRRGAGAIHPRGQPGVHLHRRPLPCRRRAAPRTRQAAILRRLLHRRVPHRADRPGDGETRPAALLPGTQPLSQPIDNSPLTDAERASLAGRLAVVTGASRGIGYAVASLLGSCGAQVIAVARTVKGLEELDDEIRANGGPGATLVPLNVTDGPGVDQLGASIYKRWGKLDILVGNAGVLGPISPLAHVKAKDWAEAMDVNVSANWRLVRTLDPVLRRSDAARVHLPHRRRRADAAPLPRPLRRLQGGAGGNGEDLRAGNRADRDPGRPRRARCGPHPAPRPRRPRRGPGNPADAGRRRTRHRAPVPADVVPQPRLSRTTAETMKKPGR